MTGQAHNLFSALANPRRRSVLSYLQRTDGANLEEMAVQLSADEMDCSVLDVPRHAVEAVRSSLEHRHIPILSEANFLRWDNGHVSLTTHPALLDPKLDDILHHDDGSWDEVLDSLANRQRRVACSILSMQSEPMGVSDLVRAVADYLHSRGEEVSIDSMRIAFHHRHLPKLEESGLLRYETDWDQVVYEGHSALDESWLRATPGDSPRSILPMGHESTDFWTLAGRENVTERGRALSESADDELFMMFTAEDSLETACIHSIQETIDRGVEVYIGTRNQPLRGLVRTHIPGATLWKPQVDWLHLHSNCWNVGRLILADREELLLGITDEATDGDVPGELAITGTVHDNPLGVFLRGLLGPRLDDIDARSDGPLREIPL